MPVLAAEQLFTRTMLGYLTHPLVKEGLLLEHGCDLDRRDEEGATALVCAIHRRQPACALLLPPGVSDRSPD